MNDYSQIAYHFGHEHFDPYSCSIIPMEEVAVGERCELTTWENFKCGDTVYKCEPGHPGWVVEGRRRVRRGCCAIPYLESHLIILDGVDGLYRCDYIKNSKKEKSDAN